MMDVFFYGLFMDVNILLKKGVKPSNPRKGYLNDYTLKIGDRASLIPCRNEKAFGIVMRLKEDEVVRLYAEKSVADYIPEKVEVVTEINDHLMVTCYNLPLELLAGTNDKYARSLYELATHLEFPKTYLNKISTYFTG